MEMGSLLFGKFQTVLTLGDWSVKTALRGNGLILHPTHH